MSDETSPARRDERLVVVCTSEEMALLRAAAARESLDVGPWARRLLMLTVRAALK